MDTKNLVGERPTSRAKTGRSNQKERTRQALVLAARDLLEAGKIPTIAQAAQHAKISEATAYRYYGDPLKLVQAALAYEWPEFDDILSAIRQKKSAADRAQIAATAMVEKFLSRERSSRACLMVDYSLPPGEYVRPFEPAALVDAILEPLQAKLKGHTFSHLKMSLNVLLAAETCLRMTSCFPEDRDGVPEVVAFLAMRVVKAYEQYARADAAESE